MTVSFKNISRTERHSIEHNLWTTPVLICSSWAFCLEHSFVCLKQLPNIHANCSTDWKNPFKPCPYKQRLAWVFKKLIFYFPKCFYLLKCTLISSCHFKWISYWTRNFFEDCKTPWHWLTYVTSWMSFHLLIMCSNAEMNKSNKILF